MKRVIFTCFYLILTLVLSAAGFFLPSSLSAYQDQQIFATIEHPSIEPMELTYSSSLPDTLQLFTKGHYFVDYPRTGSERTSDDISELVKDIFKQLNNIGINFIPLDNTVSSYNISLQLAIASEEDDSDYSSTEGSSQVTDVTSSEGKKTLFSWKTDSDSQTADEAASSSSKNVSNVSDISTAVVWSCGIYSEAGYWADLKIDDKSGKIVGFQITSDLIRFSIENKETLDKLIDTLTEFLQEYYEMQSEPILQDMLQASYAISNNQPAILEADYIIQFKEESGNLIQIPLIIREQYIRMN